MINIFKYVIAHKIVVFVDTNTPQFNTKIKNLEKSMQVFSKNLLKEQNSNDAFLKNWLNCLITE